MPEPVACTAGERDDAMITACEAARDQAALLSILYHTRQIEDTYGPPRRFIPLPGPGSADESPPSLVRVMQGGAPDPADAGRGKGRKE